MMFVFVINMLLLQEAQPEHYSRHQLLLQWQVRGEDTASINVSYMQRILGLPLHAIAMTLHLTVGLLVGHAPPCNGRCAGRTFSTLCGPFIWCRDVWAA